MTTMTTTEDTIKSAMSVARDAAEGKLSPAALERQAVDELRELVGVVVGPDDPAWPVQLDVCRGVLAAGGIGPDELSEWLAVARHRAGEPVVEPLPEPVELADAAPEPGADPEPQPVALELAETDDPQPQPVNAPVIEPVAPQRHANGYDPLSGWPGSRTLMVD